MKLDLPLVGTGIQVDLGGTQVTRNRVSSQEDGSFLEVSDISRQFVQVRLVLESDSVDLVVYARVIRPLLAVVGAMSGGQEYKKGKSQCLDGRTCSCCWSTYLE